MGSLKLVVRSTTPYNDKGTSSCPNHSKDPFSGAYPLASDRKYVLRSECILQNTTKQVFYSTMYALGRRPGRKETEFVK